MLQGDKTLIRQLLEDVLKSSTTNRGTVHTSSGHYLGAEQALDSAVKSALQGQPPNFLFYQNFHSHVLPKLPAGAVGSDDPNISSSHAQPFSVLQSVQQNVTTSQTITTALPSQPHSSPLLGAPVLPHHQAALINQMENTVATTNLASQLASQSAGRLLPVPLSYMQFLPSSQVFQHYQQAFLQQPTQLQSQLTSQSVGLSLNQRLISAGASPLAAPIVSVHSNANGGLTSQARPPARIPGDQAQRISNVYGAGQPVQSSNNSNNIASFSRSTSRVDEAATQHPSASTASSHQEGDVGGNKSPPTSAGVELNLTAS